MHVLWLLLKGTFLFFAVLFAVLMGATIAQPKAIKEDNKTSDFLLPMWLPFVFGALAVITWVGDMANGWIVLGGSAVVGCLLGFAAEKILWSRMTPEKTAAWLQKIKEQQALAQRQSEESQKRLAEERARHAAEEKLWTPVINSLAEKSQADCATLTFPVKVNLPTGGAAFGSKVLSGILSGGVGAVTEDRFLLDTIRLPETCCLCGLFPGTEEKSSSCSFQRGTQFSSLVGVNLNAQLTLRYKVCAHCGPRPETAIQLTAFSQKGDEWHASLRVLNPEVSQRIAELNTPIATATPPPTADTRNSPAHI